MLLSALDYVHTLDNVAIASAAHYLMINVIGQRCPLYLSRPIIHT